MSETSITTADHNIFSPRSRLYCIIGYYSLLHSAWPDGEVDMGSDMGPSQLQTALSSGGALLPPLGAGASEGFAGIQQTFAALIVRRFKVKKMDVG